MADLAHYYSRYDLEHRRPANKLLHAIGIPAIIAGIALAALTLWQVGLALFIAGWLLLFFGHRLEGNHPAFFQGPVYFLVGPLWVARELKHWLTDRPAPAAQTGRQPSLPASPLPMSAPLRVVRDIKHWLLAPPARSAGRRWS
ncbi:MAG TPA: Mpo1-like protein [Candidatus Acidoferrales bacterium]|nr:Mpo1-like protein [Candidatus Acidoferrales bacterium]